MAVDCLRRYTMDLYERCSKCQRRTQGRGRSRDFTRAFRYGVSGAKQIVVCGGRDERHRGVGHVVRAARASAVVCDVVVAAGSTAAGTEYAAGRSILYDVILDNATYNAITCNAINCMLYT